MNGASQVKLNSNSTDGNQTPLGQQYYMKTEYPIKGKFYKVVSGPYEGFIGEAVSVDMEVGLPVILQDLEYNTRAVNVKEIEETFRQPDGKNIKGNEN